MLLMAAVKTVPPKVEVGAVVKKGVCLHEEDGTIRLQRMHGYHCQVMCPAFSTKRQGCDFVVMSGAIIFAAGITIDRKFWQACLPKLTNFYVNKMLPALICPEKWET